MAKLANKAVVDQIVKNGITNRSVRRSHQEARLIDLVLLNGRNAPTASAGINPTAANPKKYSRVIHGINVNWKPKVSDSAVNPTAPASASKIPITARIKTRK